MSDTFTPDRLRLLRGAILNACRKAYPYHVFRSMIAAIVSEFDLDDEQLDREMAYLQDKGWLVVANVAKSVLGRKETKYRLTAEGYDVANRIDPKSPLMPEDC